MLVLIGAPYGSRHDARGAAPVKIARGPSPAKEGAGLRRRLLLRSTAASDSPSGRAPGGRTGQAHRVQYVNDRSHEHRPLLDKLRRIVTWFVCLDRRPDRHPSRRGGREVRRVGSGRPRSSGREGLLESTARSTRNAEPSSSRRLLLRTRLRSPRGRGFRRSDDPRLVPVLPASSPEQRPSRLRNRRSFALPGGPSRSLRRPVPVDFPFRLVLRGSSLEGFRTDGWAAFGRSHRPRRPERRRVSLRVGRRRTPSGGSLSVLPATHGSRGVESR